MDPITIKTAMFVGTPEGRDPRFTRTLWFFIIKGYLQNSGIARAYRGRLSLEDVLWTCARLPDLYEILPAALLRFPSHLPGAPPRDLRVILETLMSGASDGPAYHGHGFKRLLGWTRFATRDRRVRAGLRRRVHVVLPLDVAARLKAAAARDGRTQGDLAATAIERYLRGG